MAKVDAPLFSFGARGKIADALVYFPWKGIKAVRSFAIPTNPKSSAQTTQRSKMTAAVSSFHDQTFTALDMTALDRWAGTLAKIMSGFNAFVKTHIDEAILGNTWTSINNVTVDTVTTTSFKVYVDKTSGGDAPHVFIGTSPTYLEDYGAMDDDTDDTWSDTISGLSADTKYYFTIKVGASGTDFGRVGIYTQTTSAS